jgi:hypothetical protein
VRRRRRRPSPSEPIISAAGPSAALLFAQLSGRPIKTLSWKASVASIGVRAPSRPPLPSFRIHLLSLSHAMEKTSEKNPKEATAAATSTLSQKATEAATAAKEKAGELGSQASEKHEGLFEKAKETLHEVRPTRPLAPVTPDAHRSLPPGCPIREGKARAFRRARYRDAGQGGGDQVSGRSELASQPQKS